MQLRPRSVPCRCRSNWVCENNGVIFTNSEGFLPLALNKARLKFGHNVDDTDTVQAPTEFVVP